MAHLKFASKQQGVVLIIALIMVVAVTGIAVTLMSSSSVDMKITNAAFEREEAENALMGDVQQVIATEATQGGTSHFLYTQAQIPGGTIELPKIDDTTNIMSNLNNGVLDLPCPRKFNFTAGISCNMVQVNSTITYGSKSKHTITVTSGIAQEMASLNTGG
ncbi:MULTISPECIES: pilus assembly PilX family protein [Pseudoalteromonas]|uniref:Pilus assembly PilX N-terminal domain-containing protein n=1 Tax=Pseudoalteromonas rhizosphaerae TaxID=2518973 RepID=A0ABW8KR99_9GAMM|nr:MULTISPECIES: pilus assembly PilX N-terminal domain-containing protein [unclassified Pseudoalteromonas]MBB1415813.1 pilus assembly PilX N-terminal domain-containing protein [Pseudoalteromonas sp. SG44-1]MBB1478344.1 pilus assembly PilX N-terminal domain-containing protein [Pseudoalteromonas sp. SG41-2]